MARQTLAAPLPTRAGVSPSCVALPAGSWPSVLAYLCERFPMVSRDDWLRRMAVGEVVDEHARAVRPTDRFQAGLRVFYYRCLAEEAPIPFEEEVLFQDELLVVVDKPHFLPVTPGGRYVQETLLVRLKRKLGIDTLSPIHRLDRETAGLVVFCIQPQTRGRYQNLFADRVVEKRYEALVKTCAKHPAGFTYRSSLVEDEVRFMQMREESGAEPNSETRFELLERLGGVSRYRLSPVTGRKHQLRAHCSALGMPILHDRIYPELLPENTDDYARPLQLLACQLAFRDPVSGTERFFQSRRRLMELTEVQAWFGAGA